MSIKVEFIESYIKPDGSGDYIWNDNHGELIRCKDCAHRRNSHMGWYCGYEYDRSDPYEMTRRADDENYYCADAERKEHE